MQNKTSIQQIKQTMLRYAKYILCCFIIGSLALVPGCSAPDFFDPDVDSGVRANSGPGINQDSDVSPEPGMTSSSDIAQNSDTDQKQSTDKTYTTVQELVDLIVPLHTADAIDEYFDQYYTIVGEIADIDVYGDRGIIVLKGPCLNGTASNQFIFEPPPDGFEDLQEGQIVKIKGFLDGQGYEFMISLWFFECELISVGPSPKEQKDDQTLPNVDDEIPQNNVDYGELTEDSPNLPVNLSEPFGYYVKEDGVGGFSIEYVSGDDCVLIKYYIDGFPEHYSGQWIESTFRMYCDYIDFSTDNVLDFIDNDGNSVIRFDAYESYITITAPEPIYGVTIDQLNGNYYCMMQSSVLQ